MGNGTVLAYYPASDGLAQIESSHEGLTLAGYDLQGELVMTMQIEPYEFAWLAQQERDLKLTDAGIRFLRELADMEDV